MLDKPTQSDYLNHFPQWRTNLKFAQAGFAPQLACLLFYRWERTEESKELVSRLCHTLRSGSGRLVKIVKYHSQIYACEVVPSGREPNNSYFLKIAYDSFSVCFRLALNSDLYFHILLIH